MTDTPTITDDDRATAEELAHMICGCADWRQSRNDVSALLAYRQAAFDAGRKEERKRIVAFLNLCGGELANKYADWIEAGEHRND